MIDFVTHKTRIYPCRTLVGNAYCWIENSGLIIIGCKWNLVQGSLPAGRCPCLQGLSRCFECSRCPARRKYCSPSKRHPHCSKGRRCGFLQQQWLWAAGLEDADTSQHGWKCCLWRPGILINFSGITTVDSKNAFIPFNEQRCRLCSIIM
jgi:hypothetical protein